MSLRSTDPHSPPRPASTSQASSLLTSTTLSSSPAPPPAAPVDVTSQFLNAVSALRTGQLVKDELFTLFEAVSALEIMDSKMDSGYLEEGESLEDEYDVMRALLPEDVIGIMDQMLCLEVGWHMGYPLSQTLFTSIYINRLLWPEPASLEEAQFRPNTRPSEELPLVQTVLRAYCFGTIKACDFVHSMVSDQHYYEEEDFATQLFHRALLHRVDSYAVQSLLDDALSWIESASMEQTFRTALKSRLIFRQEFLNSLQADKDTHHLRLHSSLTCLPLLTEIKRSTAIGRRVEESFSMKVQRTLASSVPPRPMVTIKFDDAISHLERLCNDAMDVYQIYDVNGNQNVLTAYWTYMSHQPLPSVYIRTLAQSFLSREDKVVGKHSLKEFIIHDLESLVLPSDPLLEAVSNGGTVASDEGGQVLKLVNDFILRCSQPYLNCFRTACLNRCRIRRTLCHSCVEWDGLQAEAEELDTTLRIFTFEEAVEYAPSMPPTYSYPLSSWAYHYKLLQLEQIVQLGFELSIYAPDELCGMYWYLSHICATHLAQLDRMSFFAERYGSSHKVFDESLGTSGIRDHRGELDHTLRRLFRIFSRLKATEAFARALHRLYAVLIRCDLVVKPSRPYASDRLRHELRMKPFSSLSIPEPLDYTDFERESSISHTSDREALDDAGEAIAEARKSWEAVLRAGWTTAPSTDGMKTARIPKEQPNTHSEGRTTLRGEWTEDVKNTLRACIATSIAVGTLGKTIRRPQTGEGPQKDLKVRIPEVGGKDCYHEWWIVPIVSET